MDFQKIRGSCRFDYCVRHLTWFKTGGNADVFFKPDDVEDLVVFLKENNGKMPVTVIGMGSNMIIRDKGIEGAVIKLGKSFTHIEFVLDGLLAVGSGCLNFNLAKFALANSISGFEFMVGIPGTVGGGIAMNAGSYGHEFKDVVHSVEALDGEGNLIKLALSDIGFSHRSNSLPKNLIFTRVFFNVRNTAPQHEIRQKMDEITAKRNATQPVTEKTGGSTFVNPDGLKAWELIDRAGMRGKKLGGASISTLHCNFMINYDNATAADLENLGELVALKVKEYSGVDLKWEIKRVGRL